MFSFSIMESLFGFPNIKILKLFITAVCAVFLIKFNTMAEKQKFI